MFAALGSRVTIVDARETMLDFCDPEITEALRYHLRELNVVFRFGERVERVEAREHGTLTTLASGKVMPADVVFYSAGRVGAVADLQLENAGTRGGCARPHPGGRPLPHRAAAHLRGR